MKQRITELQNIIGKSISNITNTYDDGILITFFDDTYVLLTIDEVALEFPFTEQILVVNKNYIDKEDISYVKYDITSNDEYTEAVLLRKQKDIDHEERWQKLLNDKDSDIAKECKELVSNLFKIKTLLIYSNSGNIKYLIVDGDYSKFNGIVLNGHNDIEQDFYDFIYNKHGILKHEWCEDTTLLESKNWNKVAVCIAI